jgi:hypothetical protein
MVLPMEQPGVPLRATQLGVGLTIDKSEEGEPVAAVLISTWITTEDQEGQPTTVCVLLDPDVAAQIGASVISLAAEAKLLQDHMSQMTPEQLQEYMQQVQMRNARGLN